MCAEATRIACDVLVVGAGITGTVTARELSRAGADVVLVDRFDVGTQGSGYNAGSLHLQIQHAPFRERGEAWARAYAPATALLRAGCDGWAALADELGVDLEVDTPGGVLVAETEAQLRDVERKVAIEREQGLDVELLDRDGLRRVAPYVSDRMAGGELCRGEGKASALIAAPALARDAQRHGTRLRRHTDVTAIARDGDGFEVLTSNGSIRARRVVSAGGVDAGRITAMVGRPLPITGEAIQASVTEPVAPLVRHLVYFAGDMLTLKQSAVGTVLIGGGWPAALDPGSGRPAVSPASLDANLGVARRVVPAVANVRLVRTWAGFVNATADWLPVIDELPDVPGFFVGAFPYMGFTAGPVVGRELAALALDRTPEHDLTPFAVDRF
ncbi:MAG TPA: FAD-dependent oxidoreductase [Solirubrobacteraceae bacterium]